MKTNTKFFGTIILLTLVSIQQIDAAQINGIWVSRDRSVRMEIENCDRGIRVRHGNQGWSKYGARGNRFENKYGSFCRIIDDQSIEWYDRNSRSRHTLYRDYDDHYVRGRDSRYRNSYPNRFQGSSLRNLDGKWYNESTGQHIHVKTNRKRIKVKFHGERWIDFVQGRNGRFIDEFGNRWQIYQNRMTFESFNRDLIMEFTKGIYLGKRHKNYFNFR